LQALLQDTSRPVWQAAKPIKGMKAVWQSKFFISPQPEGKYDKKIDFIYKTRTE
jgi:hypothetical protein